MQKYLGDFCEFSISSQTSIYFTSDSVTKRKKKPTKKQPSDNNNEKQQTNKQTNQRGKK